MKNNLEKSAPEVSVIIPTFNRVDMVERAVHSVLSQSFGDFECIVVDDGSTDATSRRLAEIEDPRFYLYVQQNRGVSAARNFAVSKSCGNYIALLDSDDEWIESKLEKQLAFMKEGFFEISQTDEIWIRKGKGLISVKNMKSLKAFFERSLSMCMVSPSCVMFSRSFWDAVGPFDESMPACEDYDLWLRAGLKYPVGLLRERLTIKYGGREDQLSNSVGCLDLYRMYAIAKLLENADLDGQSRKQALDELQRKAGYFAGGCRKRGRHYEAEKVEKLVSDTVNGRKVDPAEFIGN